ncbi:MAG: [NiFe]-hydrogenase assembly chaperone HybE [Pseudomonadota bacterium]
MNDQAPGDGGAGRFEGSFLGDAARIGPRTRMECKICWSVYDPAEGDDVRQIPPGTPFAALPADWRCPTCDGERDQFMALDEPEDGAPESAEPDPIEIAKEAAARFKTVFTEIFNAKMRDTPLVNRSLSVETVGFREWEGGALGVLLAPWFMNIVLQPAAAEQAKVGDKRVFSFPSGEYEFVFNERPELGPYWACSLFSPMTEFQSQLQASETAQAVMGALFDPKHRSSDGDQAGEIRARREEEERRIEEAEAAAAAAKPAESVSRRSLLRGELSTGPGQAPGGSDTAAGGSAEASEP